MKINYLERNLSHYLPALMELVKDLEIDWNHLEYLFNENHKERLKDKIGQPVDANLYDIVLETMKENEQAYRLLHYFNILFLNVSQKTNKHQKELIKKTINDILTAFDYNYLNFIGEISVLDCLLSEKYELINIEAKWSNDSRILTTIDFKVKEPNTGNIILIEVESIHPDSNRIHQDKDKMKTFFDYRYKQKVEEKRKDLNTNDIPFHVIQVIWSGVEDLRKYSKYFKENKNHTLNPHEPMAYLTFSDADFINYEHKFNKMSTLFDNLN